MCFTPWVSLFTSLLEFAVATFILVRYRSYLVPAFSAIFIYILGLYQFTEFMLCTGNNAVLWATFGFVAYTLLPAIGLHMTTRFTHEKFNSYLLYLPPVVFSLVAFLKNDFILEVGCDRVFVMATTIFTNPVNVLSHSLYLIYYFGFLLITCFLLASHIKRNKMRKIYLWWVNLFILTVAAPVVLIVILPGLQIKLPSVYCEFALLFSIAAVASSEVYHRKRKKEKF